MSSGLEKPLATGTSSTCRVGGGGGGGGVVIEPPLHPKHASATHKLKTALHRNSEERLACMIPPHPGPSILPNCTTLRRVNLGLVLSGSSRLSASNCVLWQNRGWIIKEYGTPNHTRTRTRRKDPQNDKTFARRARASL